MDLDQYGRLCARDAVIEQHRKRMYASPDSSEQRVRVSGLGGRLACLNGKHGLAGHRHNGRRRVIMEGMGGAAFAIKDENLSLAPPAPPETTYNRGAAAFQLKGFDEHPRRCVAGSGQPAYSTRTPTTERISPPLAGALLPRNDPPADFRACWQDGSLPVRLGADVNGELRWHDPLTGAEVVRDKVDARRWLPVLIEGLRDAESAGGAYVALRGAIELVGVAAKAGLLPSLVPSIVPALKAALDLRERTVVCMTLRLLLLLLHADERVGLALRPHYKLLLPTMNAFLLKGQPSLSDEIEMAQWRRLNVEALVEEAIAAMERFGGAHAGKLIKNYVPVHRDQDECLHRGFR